MLVNMSKIRGALILLSFLPLAVIFAVKDRFTALILMAVCILAAVALLYRHLGELTDLSPDNPKMKTLKLVTIVNISVFTACVIFALLLGFYTRV